MSLSDKYGGNIDLKEKYEVSEEKKITNPSKTPLIRQRYNKEYINNIELPRDIRLEKNINSQYIEFLEDAKKLIRKYDSAYNAYKHGKMGTYRYQVLSQDKKYALLQYISFTNDVYDSGSKDWFPELINENEAYKRYWTYYPLSEYRQDYALIQIASSTLNVKHKHLGSDFGMTNIYFFNDGTIYCEGSEYLNRFGLDYLANIFDECIDKINNNEYKSFIPSITANIVFKEMELGNFELHPKILKKTINN